MRIESISLKGVLAIREALTLDFTSIPTGSLIAFVGPIGEGKTTLLETAIATVYRQFPSRDKKLVDYADERDSFMETTFSLEGRGLLRCRVHLDGAKKGTEAVLEAVAANGTRRALNDGLVKTYDAAIRQILPDFDLMRASSFSAQNKSGNFVGLSNAERLKLFNKALGNDRYEPMGKAAAANAQVFEAARARLVAVRDRLALDTAPAVVDALDARAKVLQIEGGNAEVFIAELDQQIAILDVRLSMVADQAAAYHAASLRVSALQGQVADRAREVSRLAASQDAEERVFASGLAEIAREIASARRTLTARAAAVVSTRDCDIAAIRSEYATLRADLDERIANNRGLQDQAPLIRAAVTLLAQTETLLQEGRTLERDARAQVASLDAERQGLDRAEALSVAVEDRLQRATTGGRLLTMVPCGGAQGFADCRFLTDAKAADATIPALQADLAAFGDIAARLDDVRARRQPVEAALADILTRIAAMEAQRDGTKATAALVGKLDAAEALIAERQRQKDDSFPAEEARINEVIARAVKSADDLQEQCRVFDDAEQARVAKAHADHTARVADMAQQVATVTQARDRIAADLIIAEADLRATEADSEQAQTITADLVDLRKRRDTAIATVARVHAEADSLNRQRESIGAKLVEQAALIEKIATLETELLEWQTFAKAFSRDGLPVLEIDAAGPTVSAYTNDLLQVCFGTRFTVELVTQEAKADGKGLKDNFELKVYDNQRGGAPRDVADLSGGQQVIVSEALMNAISVYVNTRSPMPIRTCWRDETTGSLDPETATRYIAMLRKVVELGGFHHCFFVSHNMDAAALADVQIRVKDGTAAIVYPPFAEAA